MQEMAYEVLEAVVIGDELVEQPFSEEVAAYERVLTATEDNTLADDSPVNDHWYSI